MVNRSQIPATVISKAKHLELILHDLGSCLVAFSGGVDSTFLLAMAAKTLGSKVLAVTAFSEIHPETERQQARKLAGTIGVKHCEIRSVEMALPEFVSNTKERCYYCKKSLLEQLTDLAARKGYAAVIDGSNLDDRNDYRPGRAAVAELGVRSPLEEAGLTKEEIRLLSHNIDLPTWDKPAYACLATRLPYGTEINSQKLAQVEQVEEALMGLGLRTLRVRHHGDIARLELGEEEFQQATGSLRLQINMLVRQAGFDFVAVDLQGYRSGSMNIF